MSNTYRTIPGYAFKRSEGGAWQHAEIVVLPQAAEGCSKAVAFVNIDGAPCVVFDTLVGRFAQTRVACEVAP